MASYINNPVKAALRKHMKQEILSKLTAENKACQSKSITEKVLQSEAFRKAQRISIYLSTPSEVDTGSLLREMFRLDKMVFVPTYNGSNMEMVRLKDMEDYETLPLTKWNIKQPNVKDARENALTNGHGIDLFLMPGVAFTLSGDRLGHGMGYYDSYLARHFGTYAQKTVYLMALAFREQVVAESDLRMEKHDVRLNQIMTAD